MLAKRSKTRPRRERLRPDDFDDVQYNVEVVRLGESPHDAAVDAANDRLELVESAVVVFVGAAVVAVALAAGVVALEPTVAMARDALWYVLPMVVLPALWLGVLHAWEKLLLTPADAASPAPPISTRRHASKVAIF